MELVNVSGEIPVGSCFVGKNGEIHDFFNQIIKTKKVGERCIWKVTRESDGIVAQQVMAVDDPFLVPTDMLNQLPDGYLIQEEAIFIRLRLGKNNFPVLFPYVNAYDLLINDKVLALITKTKKKPKRKGLCINEQEKKLYVINEFLLTMDELIYGWSIWTDIFKGYLPLIVLTNGTNLSMMFDEKQFSLTKTDEKPFGDLASLVIKAL